ncbi:MAG: hypothetical protein PHX51_06690 [Clostridia bacterium]|nr:hypothetical protein [Clostridia bacterium]
MVHINTPVNTALYDEIRSVCKAKHANKGALITALLTLYRLAKAASDKETYLRIMSVSLPYSTRDNIHVSITEEAAAIFRDRTEQCLLDRLFAYFLSLPEEEQNKLLYLGSI